MHSFFIFIILMNVFVVSCIFPPSCFPRQCGVPFFFSSFFRFSFLANLSHGRCGYHTLSPAHICPSKSLGLMSCTIIHVLLMFQINKDVLEVTAPRDSKRGGDLKANLRRQLLSSDSAVLLKESKDICVKLAKLMCERGFCACVSPRLLEDAQMRNQQLALVSHCRYCHLSYCFSWTMPSTCLTTWNEMV